MDGTKVPNISTIGADRANGAKNLYTSTTDANKVNGTDGVENPDIGIVNTNGAENLDIGIVDANKADGADGVEGLNISIIGVDVKKD